MSNATSSHPVANCCMHLGLLQTDQQGRTCCRCHAAVLHAAALLLEAPRAHGGPPQNGTPRHCLGIQQPAYSFSPRSLILHAPADKHVAVWVHALLAPLYHHFCMHPRAEQHVMHLSSCRAGAARLPAHPGRTGRAKQQPCRQMRIAQGRSRQMLRVTALFHQLATLQQVCGVQA